MIDIGLKIKDYLINNEALILYVNDKVYNQFVDDSTVVTPFIVVDIDNINIETDIMGYDYHDVAFTINIIESGYESLIELSKLIKSLFINDIQTDEYIINNIHFDSFSEFYNQNYIGKITFKCKI